MTKIEIENACKLHGAKNVGDACYAAMNGQRQQVERLKLPIYGVGNLYAATNIAHELMTQTEQSADYAAAVVAAAMIK